MSATKKPSASTLLPKSRTASERRMGAAVGVPYGEHSTFAPGYVLQDRFRILRFLARGGAGEVYEAFDTELRCPVALKLVRPEVATNEQAIDRFRREIALARQVTHPNVSRIFDVFRVQLPARHSDGQPLNTLFLSMELLVGESLAGRLRRLGPLSQAQALPLIVDMIEGLKAAHRAGVIHRDLKSANVMLARSGDEVRAVIMDFGLALELAHDPNDPDPLTHSGVVVGTPNYMAPEQLTGGEITPLVDQYSLGIVFFEMLTGERPFRGDNEVSTAVKRLTEPPPSPRSLVPELDLNWERAILRMLETDAARRFSNLDDIIHTLIGQPEAATSKPARKPKRKVRPSVLYTAGGAVLLALAVGQAAPQFIQQFGSKSQAGSMLAEQGSASLALASLSASDLPAEDRWMATALSGLLEQSLQGEGLEVARVAPPADSSPPTEERARLDVPLYTAGSFSVDSSSQRATLALTFVDDSTTKEIVTVGSAQDLLGLAREAAAKVRDAAGLPSMPSPDSSALLLGAARSEAQSGRRASALRILQQLQDDADDIDDPNADAEFLAELAHLLQYSGDRPGATSAATRALQSSTDPQTRSRALAVQSWSNGDLTKAAEHYSDLHDQGTGGNNIDRGAALGLAEIRIEQDRPEDALTVLRGLSLSSRAPERPASEIASQVLTARAQNRRGAFAEALRAARRAVDMGVAAGADWLLAEARIAQSYAHLGRNEIDQARQALRTAIDELEGHDPVGVHEEALEALIALEQEHGSQNTVFELGERLARLRAS